MFNKFSLSIKRIIEDLASEEHSGSNQSRVVFAMFAIIAGVMSVLNIITHKTILLIATASFCILCLIDWLLVKKSARNTKLANLIFGIEVVILLSYFVITGGTDNFSIIWLLMLPSLGLFFFGISGGTLMTVAMLAIMLVCFYTPALQDIVTDYTSTFRMRFPLVYIASFLVSYILEAIRRYTALNLRLAREKYEYLYNHDPLTGILTRGGADDYFAKICKTEGNIGLAMFDIDHFRDFNTLHGHAGGDKVLKYIAKALEAAAKDEDGEVYRWGGEEFLILYPNGDVAEESALNINKEIGKTPFELDGKTYYVTISGGVYIVNGHSARDTDFTAAIEIADKNLYDAKNSGRNKVVITREKEQ